MRISSDCHWLALYTDLRINSSLVFNPRPMSSMRSFRCPKCRMTKPTSLDLCFRCQPPSNKPARTTLQIQTATSKSVCLRKPLEQPRQLKATITKSMYIVPSIKNEKPKITKSVSIVPSIEMKPTIKMSANTVAKEVARNSTQPNRDRSVSVVVQPTRKLSPNESLSQFKSTQDFKSKDYADKLEDELGQHILTMTLKLSPSKSCTRHPSTQETIKQNQRKLKNQLQEAKSKLYEDETFLHNRSSLYLEDKQADEQYDRLEWLRLADIRCYDNEDKAIKFESMCVRSSPATGDVLHFRQGAVGDCWFVSALGSVLYRHPQHLPVLVPDPKVYAEGVYQVCLYLNGVYVSTFIDDYFPCQPQSKTLAFSQALGKQLFAPIIEKALAKHHSCYQALHSGTSLEGFALLTGMAGFSIRQPGHKDMANLDVYLRKGFLVSVGCRRPVEGLQANHAYSIFRIENHGSSHSLLLWNPWANQKLSGALKNYDLSMARKLHRPEGTFWISEAKFVQYFGQIDVCRYRHKWHSQRFTFTVPKDLSDQDKFTVFELTINKPTELDFTLYQEMRRDRRIIAKLSVQLILFAIDKKNRLCYVDASGNICSSSGSFNVSLGKGRFVLGALSFSHWGSSSRMTKANPCLVLSICGSHKYEVKPRTSETTLLGDMLIEYYTSPRNQLCDHKPLTNKSAKEANFVCHYLKKNNENDWAFSGMVIENKDDKCYIEYECAIPILSNCFNIRRTHERNTRDIVPPRTCQLILLIAMDCDKNEARYEQRGKITLHNDLSTLRSKFEIPSEVVRVKQLFAPRRLHEPDHHQNETNQAAIVKSSQVQSSSWCFK